MVKLPREPNIMNHELKPLHPYSFLLHVLFCFIHYISKLANSVIMDNSQHLFTKDP